MSKKKMSSSGNIKDMDERYRRICICDCNSGRFITSISKKQIQVMYDTIVKVSLEAGDWFQDPIKDMVLQTITELKEYVSDNEPPAAASTS
jgi:hypothetical protein